MVIFFETTGSKKDRDFCELLEALAERFSRSVHVITSSTVEAAKIDNLLWTFKKDSFVPHVILGPGESIEGRLERVFITVGLSFLKECGVAVPLDTDYVEDALSFYEFCIVLVVGDDEAQKKWAREFWRKLTKAGIPKQHVLAHDRNSWFEVFGNIWGDC
jgi:DNA polymerase IIIc chi subunit